MPRPKVGFVLLTALVSAIVALAAPPMRHAPSPLVTVALTDGAALHLTPLPLGRINGVVQGAPRYDAGSSRVVFIAAFPGTAIGADWRRANPTQAFALDIARRSLTQLTTDGMATAVRWRSPTMVAIDDGGARKSVAIGGPEATDWRAGHRRVVAFDDVLDSSDADVMPPLVYRLGVWKRASDTYAITQIGARYLRTSAVAPDHSTAIVGDYLLWVDHDKRAGFTLDRFGPDEGAVPTFSGSAYGDALTPVMPLGHNVYQAAYRNGVAYFAFTYGLDRIVAATSDLAEFDYPSLPADPAFTIGDGLGAGSDGILYFASPEAGALQFWRHGHYRTLGMRFPADVSQPAALQSAMGRFDASQPPLRPDVDALDTALLQWRIYPVGDATGTTWIASYLGRVMLGDSGARFHYVRVPFPFAVLGRTDDGRLWGATPVSRSIVGSLVAQSASELWSSADGVAWRLEAVLDGDAGAVGANHRVTWVALTREWLGRPLIAVARLDSSHPQSALTGASYAGEQLMFAGLRTGFYLISGATPAMRLSGDEGALCASRLDADALFQTDGAGTNVYMRERLDPSSNPALPPATLVGGAEAIVAPTLTEFAQAPRGEHLTLVTTLSPGQVDAQRVTVMSAGQERAFQIEYGERPYPLATIAGAPSGDRAIIDRRYDSGPLHAHGTRERWVRTAAGDWRLDAVLSRFGY